MHTETTTLGEEVVMRATLLSEQGIGSTGVLLTALITAETTLKASGSIVGQDHIDSVGSPLSLGHHDYTLAVLVEGNGGGRQSLFTSLAQESVLEGRDGDHSSLK